jgi:uncharacterized membrane protein YbhN (UPF0104 family)
MKTVVTFALKLLVTLGIFVLIFLEFGGGYAPVDTAALRSPGAFEVANPAYPGIVGRLRARLTGTRLPPPRLPVSLNQVCIAAAERPVFVRTAEGDYRRFKPGRHCGEGGITSVYVPLASGEFRAVPLAEAPAKAFFRLQGFQIVPAELSDLWGEIKGLDWRIFVPWFLAAILVKLIGIFANVWRWQILLAGQGIEMTYGFLNATYFIGRYFGIVTPSTMGLDAWRLYETIRLTRKPVECTTTLVVERLLGLVGLFVVILLFMPFAGRITQGQSFGELVAAMKIPIAATAAFGVLILLQPDWFRGLLRLVPSGRLRKFAANAIDSATAYSKHRGYLLLALGIAIFGQLTTTLMYFCNAMALATQNVHAPEVLFASAIMTLGTFIAPSASGEGVREVIFVWLLGSKAGAAKAFLIGNLGFWIEKLPLSVPGGIILLLRKDPTLHAVTKADLERVRADATREVAGARS